jgi:hypothetical protein
MRNQIHVVALGAFALVGLSFGGSMSATTVSRHRAASSATTVTTTADTVSPCPPSAISLRCAIDQANLDGSGDTIAFQIGAADAGCRREKVLNERVRVCTITIAAGNRRQQLSLKATDTLIDGYTQPGARPNDNAMGSGLGNDAIVTLVLDASTQRGNGSSALVVAGSTDTVRGLCIVGSAGSALSVAGDHATVAGNFIGLRPDGVTAGHNGTGVRVQGADSTVGSVAASDMNVVGANAAAGIAVLDVDGANIVGNLVGTDRSGTKAVPNGVGISLSKSSNDVVGGIAFAASNLVSGNTSSGIRIFDGSKNLVEGNFVGTDLSGANAVGNGSDGSAGITLITKTSRDTDNVVGGTVLGSINVISGNKADGVDLLSTRAVFASGNAVIGNAIGSTPDGKSGLPNGANGVYVASTNGASIGEAAQSTGNLIAFNTLAGVLVGSSPSDTSTHVAINHNTIFSNGGLGIDLSPAGTIDCATAPPGPNDYTPCPVITAASTESAAGTACAGCFVEVFIGTNDPKDAGHGEGIELLGTGTATGSGVWNIEYLLGKPRTGDPITATASRPASRGVGSETSEFAANVAAGTTRRRSPLRQAEQRP